MADRGSPFMRGSRQFPMGAGLRGAAAVFDDKPSGLREADPLLQKMHGSTLGDAIDLRASMMQSLNLTHKPPEKAAFVRRALEKLPMLADVNPQQLDRMIAAMEFVRLQPREVLLKVGQVNDFCYFIQSGRVQCQAPDGSGQYLLQGEMFGVEALSASDLPVEYTAIAQGSSELWRLHRRAFKLLQMDYGARLRMAVQSVVDANRAVKQKNLSAMQSIVQRALEDKREREALNKSLFGRSSPTSRAPSRSSSRSGPSARVPSARSNCACTRRPASRTHSKSRRTPTSRACRPTSRARSSACARPAHPSSCASSASGRTGVATASIR